MIRSRRLALSVLPSCTELSNQAGWNQTEDDWRLILGLGRGQGLFDGSRLVATAAVIPYGDRFGWVCMVLVAADRRRKGYATSLMRWALETLKEASLVPGLDATAEGREVYRRLGFSDIYQLTRLQANSIRVGDVGGGAGQTRAFLEADVASVSAYDAAAFGEDRRAVVAALRARRPDLAVTSEAGGRTNGFLLARDGRLATQIGPVVADDEGTARALLASALSRVEGAAYIDLADRHVAIRAWLASMGFSEHRRFSRMLAGRDAPFGDPAKIVAVAGPELG